MYVPPALTYRPARGPAYLLAWEQPPDDRSWWAQILWGEVARDGYTGRHARRRRRRRAHPWSGLLHRSPASRLGA
ncbi:hypothetical protein [Actinomadura litoris]|uniref:hypothetical protein n=1 Tax=Actinomadura litoris TaxID=2678616 RepID=UPI001FA78456|nr:hypothetical protein [Actinomadura litoris]